ncbi:MAG: GerMN domain-containing protein [bacterium]|nr:GerMN domain-containing protein [bacterium]
MITLKSIFSILLIVLISMVILAAVALFMLEKNKLPEENNKPETNEVKNEDINVSFPKSGQAVQSPLSVEGEARGTWFFEASFPIKILDEAGNVLATSYVQATKDWMTEDFVPFKGEISFVSKTRSNGFLVLAKDNPSGLPENDREIRLPIILEPTEMVKVNVYFNVVSQLGEDYTCENVLPAERIIPKTQAPATAALEELLKGPTSTEKTSEGGYSTSINSGVKIKSLTIENGTAKIDFDEQLEFQVGGSCRVSAIRAQITETLKQFSTIKNVIISINGRTEDILQP